MQNTREELISVAEKGGLDQFVSFLKLCKTDGHDLQEVLSGCSKSQLDKLWDSIQQKCATTFMSLEVAEENEDQMQEELQKLLDVLEGVVNLASAAINQQEIYVPVSLYSTSVVLNGLLLPLPEKAEKLKNIMSHLFEVWWQKEIQGAEELMSNTFIYLLQRSLQTQTMVDVKRVWTVHEALSQVDLTNESSKSLKNLLKQCTYNIAYLRCSEGCRFLAYILSQEVELTKILHNTIKNHLSTTARSWLVKYGEIYFRAWQRATGPVLEKLETSCIQDLMYNAVHTRKPLCQSLRRILCYIHNQKKQKGVEDMLLKLYDPILWRSLKVANPLVRVNATAILMDVFPLQDPDSKIEETNKLMQKQFDTIMILLDDPVPVVRSTAVAGVFKIMSVYWEMIPAEIIQSLISKIILELIWDASSADVRENVIKGLIVLLDNPLCHSVLKPILPELKNFVHDSSEKVRVAMLDMLLKVKGLRAIRFWSIVPVEHLLARLEIDTPPIARRIMKLIFSSFMPADKPADVQIGRCVTLIQTNIGAARQFYNKAHNHMSIQDTVNYITLLCRCILQCMKAEAIKNRLNDTGDGGKYGRDQDDTQIDVSEDELSVHNIKLMTRILEAIVLLWNSVSVELDKTCNKEILLGLQNKFMVALPEMFKAFNDSQILTSLIMIAGNLPSKSVPSVSRSCLSKLRKMEENKTEDYGCFLEVMCNWGKIEDVFEMVDEWIKASMPKAVKNILASYATTVKRTRKSVGFVEPSAPRPQLGLEYISYLIKHPTCQAIILSKYRDNVVELIATLQDVRKCIEGRMTNRIPTEGDDFTDDLLVECFTVYLKLLVLLHDDGDNSAILKLCQVINWSDSHLIPVLESQDRSRSNNSTPSLSSESDNNTHSNTQDFTQGVFSRTLYNVDATVLLSGGRSRKRSIGKATPHAINLASNVIQGLLSVCSNMFLIGIADEDFSVQVTNFCSDCLQADSALNLLPQIITCFYQVTEFILLSHHVVDNNSNSQHGNLISDFFGKTFVSLAVHISKKKEHGIKALNLVKGPVTEILMSVYKSNVLESTVIRDLSATMVAAVLAEMSNASRNLDLDGLCDGFTSLPHLSAWLCEIVCRKSFIARNFLTELSVCIDSGAITDLHNLHGASHLLATIVNGRLAFPGTKDCWESIHRELEKLKRKDLEQLEGVAEQESMRLMDQKLALISSGMTIQ